MEKEIVELRNQLANQHSQQVATNGIRGVSYGQAMPQMTSSLDQYIGSHEAVASLLDLKSGVEGFMRSPNPVAKPIRRLEDVTLSPDQVQELFDMYVSSLCLNTNVS